MINYFETFYTVYESPIEQSVYEDSFKTIPSQMDVKYTIIRPCYMS